MIKEIKDKITDTKTGKLKTNFIVAIGLIGIALIFLSGLGSNNDEQGDKADNSIVLQNTDVYRENLEQQLEAILSDVQGAGDVSVMISLEGTIEYIYAEEIQSSSQHKDTDKSSDYKNEVVLVEGKDGKDALVKKVINPRVNGVLIVCDGGDDVILSEKLINSASAALGISTAKIYVAKRTK